MNAPKIGGLQVGIILLTVAAAAARLLERGPVLVLTLSCLGYLGLLGALYLPIPFFIERRSLVRYLLMGYVALTIMAWIGMGDKNLVTGYVGYIAQVIRIVLIVLLWLENQRAKIGR